MTLIMRTSVLALVVLCLAASVHWSLGQWSTSRVDLLAMQAAQGQDLARWQLQVAVWADHPRALLARGLLMLAEQDPANTSRGLDLLERAARKGETEAAMDLGRIHFHGLNGAAPDYALARRWLEMAVSRQPAAAYYLALIDRNGLDGPAHPERALAGLKQAADGGIAEAQFLLGNACLSGEAGERDEALASHYFRQAAEQEHPGALQALALAHAHGELGLPRDEAQANVLFALAADALQGQPRRP
ncbi:MAG: tetratricopeptide repeat protein [Pseudomonadota bacterium]